MALVIPKPVNPTIQAMLDYVTRMQEERYRREQERAEERERQEQRAIVGGSIALGAVGGGLIGGIAAGAGAGVGAAGAGAFSGGAATFAPSVAAGVGATSGALTGAAIGGRIGQQFAGGDYAGGVGTAAQAVGGVIQAREDQQLYGYSPTSQERAQYSRMALKAGMSIPQLQAISAATGKTAAQVIYAAQVGQADRERKGDMLASMGIPLDPDEFDEIGATHPGGSMGLILDYQEEQAGREAQSAAVKTFYTKDAALRAEQQFYAQAAGNLKPQADPREVNERDHKLAEVTEAFRSGQINVQEATQWLDEIALAKPRMTHRPAERPVREDWQENFSVQSIVMPDGSRKLARFGRRRPTPSDPTGSSEFGEWVGEEAEKEYRKLLQGRFVENLKGDPITGERMSAADAMARAKEEVAMLNAAVAEHAAKDTLDDGIVRPPAAAAPPPAPQMPGGPPAGPKPRGLDEGWPTLGAPGQRPGMVEAPAYKIPPSRGAEPSAPEHIAKAQAFIGRLLAEKPAKKDWTPTEASQASRAAKLVFADLEARKKARGTGPTAEEKELTRQLLFILEK